jgi:hypothetical protein
MSVELICPFSTLIVDWRTISEAKWEFSTHPVISCGIKSLAQMHLGYHELRNMLMKFREDREKRKAQAAPPAPVPSSGGGGSVGGRGSEHRPPRDDHRDRERDRDRDRGYSERHSSSRYEYVWLVSSSGSRISLGFTGIVGGIARGHHEGGTEVYGWQADLYCSVIVSMSCS